MRKINVLTFLTIDGVMQAPGGSEEDKRRGFKYGGWTVPYFDDFMGSVMAEQMGQPYEMLLGRVTYDLFASHWPQQKGNGAEEINAAKKYVVSNGKVDTSWQNSQQISGDVVAEIKKLKVQDGPMLQVHGSGKLIQALLTNDLVDEFWLKIFPVTIGGGERLFSEGTMPAAFKVLSSKTSPKGVIVVNYARDGKLQTGSF